LMQSAIRDAVLYPDRVQKTMLLGGAALQRCDHRINKWGL
jgi:hypothetical protein